MFRGKDSEVCKGLSSHAMAVSSTAAALLLMLSACAAPDQPTPVNLDSSFGNAVRQNMAVQVINPDAAGPDESDRIDGQSAERALEAQRTRSAESEPESLIINVGS